MENSGEEPKVDRSKGPARKPSANTKFYVVIVVLIVIAAAFAVLAFYHPSTSTSGVTANVVTTKQAAIGLGSTYSFYVNETSSSFNVSVWWGDGTHALINATSTSLKLSHQYNYTGDYFIMYSVNGGTNNLIPLTVGYPSIALKDFNASYGTLELNSNSTAPVIGSPMVFGPGVNLTYAMGAGAPYNSTYQTVDQSMIVLQGASMIQQQNYQYVATNLNNVSAPEYQYEAPGSMIYYLNGLTAGYYTLILNTSSAPVNIANGVIDYTNLTSTLLYTNVPIFDHVNLPSSSSTVFTNAELASGGYRTLDPAIAYDTVSNEILDNVAPPLIVYNGNSTTEFNPFLVTQLPNTTNGGISSNGMNFTFTIRANATFSDGNTVKAWDVYYSLVRTLLFINPYNPGWILGQYLLPGNYYTSNTYANITQALTVDNASNSITLHFTTAISPTLAFQLLAASGGFITEASWLIANGAGITFTTAGFAAYTAYGEPGNYNTYVQNHIMGAGPYMLSYIIPGQEVVLQANPYYKEPGSWYPAPTIQTVAIQYLSNTKTPYQEMLGGSAQMGGVPTTSWGNAVSLLNQGVVNIYHFPSLSVFFYNFNAATNTTLLSTVDPTANLPGAMFTSPHARKAFAYAYNETKYLTEQLGNPAYPDYAFGAAFAGIIPAGMAYYQTMAQLNTSTGGQVPYFSLAMAQAQWNIFLSNSGKTLGITMSGGKAMYNGNQVTIPVFFNSPDPTDQAGISSWATYVSSAMGIKLQLEPIAFEELINYEYGSGPGTNLMPIYLLGWAPDYPFPTDYLLPMALPNLTLSVYPATDGMYPEWINSTANPVANSTEAAQMVEMNTLYQSAFKGSESASLQMDRLFINLTFQVELFQQVSYWIVSSHITPSSVQNYQENVMIGGGADMLYNFLTYT